MRKVELIINGDDFGGSAEVNEAIIRAHREGVLTSCSLMVAGDAFHQAVLLAKQNERLAVGLHLVTVKGRSVLPRSRIPSLVDDYGRFPGDPTLAGIRYFFSERARRDLRLELEAQFARFAATGLDFSHIDSHLHMHVHPVVFQIAVELGRRFGVPRMRVPRDDFGLVYRLNRRDSMRKAAPALIFNLLCRRMRRRLDAQGFTYPERVYGHFYTGEMSETTVLSMLDHIRTATGELYFHPAVRPHGQTPDREQLQCERELNILMSGKVKEKLTARRIKLTTYPQLSSV